MIVSNGHHRAAAAVRVVLLLFLVSCSMLVTTASPNGCLYKCTVVSNQCIFTAQEQAAVTTCDPTLDAITDINQGEIPTNCNVGGSALAAGKCDVNLASSVTTGTCGTVQKTSTPLPLTNGDCIVEVAQALTGKQLNFALLQIYAIALRRKLMFYPDELTSTSEFNKWTKPLTDCGIKVGTTSVNRATTTTTRLAPQAINTAMLQVLVNNVCDAAGCAAASSTCNGNEASAHNYLLQFLEESIIDMVCLIDTDLTVGDPERCAGLRSRTGIGAAELPDCWVAGWEAIFQVTAPVDSLTTFTGTGGTVGDASCTSGDSGPGDEGSTIKTSFCLSANSIVPVQDKGLMRLMRMSELSVGDMVQVDSADPPSFEPIYMFGHNNPDETTVFLEIHTSNQALPLEITADHLVFRMDMDDKSHAIPASMLQVGDQLVTTSDRTGTHEIATVTVTAIDRVIRQGVYAPFTLSGTIVVNGIIVSNYIALQQDSEYLHILGKTSSSWTFHELSHTFLAGHRLAWRLGLLGLKKNQQDLMKPDTNQAGLGQWVAFPYQWAAWLLNNSEHQSTTLTLIILIPLIGFFGLVSWMEQIMTNPTAVAVLVLAAVHMLYRRTHTRPAGSSPKNYCK